MKPCPFCGSEDVCLDGVGKTSFVTCLSCNTDGPTATEEEAAALWESGSYWWLENDEYATPAVIYVMKSGTDGSCFASAGQLGWRRSRTVKELGGLWQRIPEPELPEEEDNE